jgi:hypothetical protein
MSICFEEAIFKMECRTEQRILCNGCSSMNILQICCEAHVVYYTLSEHTLGIPIQSPIHNKSRKHASEVKDVKHTSWYATHAMQYMKTYMVTNWTYGAQHTSNTLGNCTSETKRVKNTLWNDASEVKCVRNTLQMMHIKFNMLNTHYQIQASRSESESGSPGRSQGQGLNQNMYMVMVAPMESFTRSLDPQL